MSAPMVSVVTPFYNTAAFLGECIESVLAQDLGAFEYLLVNNCSTDGSDEIARRYARLDRRIRVFDNAAFVGQVENYNGALARVSEGCQYVKLVQADDVLLPSCLSEMTGVGRRHPSAAIIASYYLEGDRAVGWGIPLGIELVTGREACRAHLLGVMGVFGTPTTVMYRSDLVHRRRPFYTPGRYHEDSELCFEVLGDADLGFVHQILSVQRLHEGSILDKARAANWRKLDAYLTLRMFGERYLEPKEYRNRLRTVRRDYLQYLAECVFFSRDSEVFAYHRRGLATIGEKLPYLESLLFLPRALGKAIARPRWALAQWRESWYRRIALNGI